MLSRRVIGMLIAEFIGTAFLTSVILAVGKSGVGFSYFLSTGVALAFFGGSLFMAGVSGAHFNPAVTLGMWSVRRVGTLRAIFYIAAQLLGGLAAWGLYNYLTGQKLPSTTLTFSGSTMVAEAIAGGVIVIGVAAAVYQSFDRLQAAATVALAIFIGTMIASLGSNGIGNPAIALGVHDWSWQYVAGPLIGGIIGANLYLYLFAPREAIGNVIARASNFSTKGFRPSRTKKSSKKK